jgi:acetyl/propionyl-CoA carboxylase alpha subunit
MSRTVVTVDGVEFEIELTPEGSILVGGSELEGSVTPLDESSFSVMIGSRSSRVTLHHDGASFTVGIGGRTFSGLVESPRVRLLKRYSGTSGASGTRQPVKAPMPALVVRVHVAPGDRIEPGSRLLVLEAMKMENEIKSNQSGVVKSVHVKGGQAVEKGQLLISVE